MRFPVKCKYCASMIYAGGWDHRYGVCYECAKERPFLLCCSCRKPVAMCNQIGCIDPRDDGFPDDDY